MPDRMFSYLAAVTIFTVALAAPRAFSSEEPSRAFDAMAAADIREAGLVPGREVRTKVVCRA